jgi:hypothetical protein
MLVHAKPIPQAQQADVWNPGPDAEYPKERCIEKVRAWKIELEEVPVDGLTVQNALRLLKKKPVVAESYIDRSAQRDEKHKIEIEQRQQLSEREAFSVVEPELELRAASHSFLLN